MTQFSRSNSRGWLGRLLGSALVVAFSAALVAPALAQGPLGTIQGRITAAAGGAPLAGAQVTVEGTLIGVRTGEDGRFSLVVPAGARTIRVLAIGYKVGTLQVTVAAGGTATANLELSRSVLRLDEVVVTGTAGETRRRELGNSIAQINLAAEVKDPPANVDQLLQARTVGLDVMQTGASAGAGAQIRLRGGVSVNQSNQPIIYIDGIRVRSEGYRRNAPGGADFTGRGSNIQNSPLNDISPADIERIEVIKGAAAATLYGTEASAGVIQIFTKKGSRTARPRWSIEASQGIARTRPFGPSWNPYLNLTPPDSMGVDANGQLIVLEDRRVTAGQCHPGPQKDAFGNTVQVPPANNARCSWIRDGWRQRYNGSVAGGFDVFQYFLSGSWEDNEGVLPQDREKKLATRGNFTFDLSDKLRLDFNTGYTNYRIVNSPTGNNAQGLLLNVYRAERNYRSSSDPAVIDSLLNQDITTEIDRLVTGGTVYYTPTSWFNHRFTVGFDFAAQENRTLRPFGFVGAPLGRLHNEKNKYTILTADYAGNVDYRLGGGLSGTFSFGGQTVANEESRTFAYGQDFAGPGEPTVSGAALWIAEEDRERVVNAGFFLQNIFKLNERYFLTAGARFDGNSAFGESLGLAAYPKVSVSYVTSDEPWWPGALGEMKLRAALGYAGRAPDPFDKLRTYSPISYAGLPGVTPRNLGDTLIGPERTREIEVGFESGLFNERVSAEFTYYHRRTSDALMSVRQIPSLGGWGSQTANVGTLRNKGVELAINATVIDKPDFGLDLGGTLYTNNSLVVDLGTDAFGNDNVPFAANQGWVQEGFPIVVARGKRIKLPGYEGVAPANGATVMTVIGGPLDTACVPANGDPCAADGQYVFGPLQPTRIIGGTATLRLPKGISISARGEYQTGAWIGDGASDAALSRSVIWPTCRRAYLVLQSDGTANDATQRTQALTPWEQIICPGARPTGLLYDGDILWYRQDFFKLRDLTLTVPVGFAVPAAEAATLRISVQNWFRKLYDMPLFDPEMTSRSGLDEQNRSISEHVPPPATVTASLRITF
jgi:TonB-linked SusC/RagA family outer membrane protein